MNGKPALYHVICCSILIEYYGSIIKYINKHEGVEWMPLGQMAEEFSSGRIDGASVAGGADPGDVE